MTKRPRRDSLSSLSEPLTLPLLSRIQPTTYLATPVESPPAKVTELDASVDPVITEVIRCALPPHKDVISFTSYEDYEIHYKKAHVNRCLECGKNFPTYHFLNLHIEENHDPLLATRRERGEKICGCFVEGCGRKCSTPKKRKRHLIDKHMFPKTYNFSIIDDGIDKHGSMLQSSTKITTTTMRTSNGHHRRRRLSAPISHIYQREEGKESTGRLRNRHVKLASNNQEHHSPSLSLTGNTNMIISRDRNSDSSDKLLADPVKIVDDTIGIPPSAYASASSETPGPNSTKSSKSSDSSNTIDATDVDGSLTKSMAALRFVPTSVMRNLQSRKRGLS